MKLKTSDDQTNRLPANSSLPRPIHRGGAVGGFIPWSGRSVSGMGSVGSRGRHGSAGPNDRCLHHQPNPANPAMTRLNVEHPTSNFQRRTEEPAGKSNIFSSTSTFDVGRSMFDVPIPSPDGETKTQMIP